MTIIQSPLPQQIPMAIAAVGGILIYMAMDAVDVWKREFEIGMQQVDTGGGGAIQHFINRSLGRPNIGFISRGRDQGGGTPP